MELALRPGTPADRDAIAGLDLSDEVCVVAEAGGEVVGYGAMSYSFFQRGFIRILHVSESHRCQGIGSRIMRALEERCATDRIFTSTNESNVRMQALLERLGYERSGKVDHLDPDDPELFYSRVLQTPDPL